MRNWGLPPHRAIPFRKREGSHEDGPRMVK